jgi:hypothetical protein
MALTDIDFAAGEKTFIVEVPTASHTGRLSDISYGNRNRNSFIVELLKLIALISYRRKVR